MVGVNLRKLFARQNRQHHLGLGYLHRLDLEDVAIQNDQVGQFAGGDTSLRSTLSTDQGCSHAETPDRLIASAV